MAAAATARRDAVDARNAAQHTIPATVATRARMRSPDLGIPPELEIREPYARAGPSAYDAVVDAQSRGRLETDHRARGHVIVLFDSVAAHANPAHQDTILIYRRAPGEPDDAALVEKTGISAATRAGPL